MTAALLSLAVAATSLVVVLLIATRAVAQVNATTSAMHATPGAIRRGVIDLGHEVNSLVGRVDQVPTDIAGGGRRSDSNPSTESHPGDPAGSK